jgi:hypothetical protein
MTLNNETFQPPRSVAAMTTVASVALTGYWGIFWGHTQAQATGGDPG